MFMSNASITTWFMKFRKVLIILATTTLNRADEVPGKIGDPKPFGDNSSTVKSESSVNGTSHPPQQKSGEF